MRASALLAFVVAAPAWAAGVAPADQDAMQQVITRQMEAFQRDDDAQAFDFASPALQEMFGNAGRFMAMVRGGYAPVYRPRSVTFGVAEDVAGVYVQEVGVVGAYREFSLSVSAVVRHEWEVSGTRYGQRFGRIAVEFNTKF